MRSVIRQVIASYARQYGQSSATQSDSHGSDPLEEGSESPTSSISESPPPRHPSGGGRHSSDPLIKPALSIQLGVREAEDVDPTGALERRRSSRTSRRPSKGRGRIRSAFRRYLIALAAELSP